MKTILSTQNPLIKHLLKLQKAQERKKSGLAIVEGFREINRALQCGVVIEKLLFCSDIANAKELAELLQKFDGELIELSAIAFNKLAIREDNGGFLAVIKPKILQLSDLSPKGTLTILILEGIEKPGNLGAILRTADGLGVVDAVIVSENACEIYNRTAIRASLGGIFNIPIVRAKNEEIFTFCELNKIKIVVTDLKAEVALWEDQFESRIGIVLGTESEGISDFWRKNAALRVKIPMHGVVDSFNVSVTAAMLLYERKKQLKA